MTTEFRILLAKLAWILVLTVLGHVALGAHSWFYLGTIAIIGQIALIVFGFRRIDAFAAFLGEVSERRRRRIERTERWVVTLGRGYSTVVYVPIDAETGHGSGALELAMALADAEGKPWTGEGGEPASGHGLGGHSYLNPWKERLAEWLARR